MINEEKKREWKGGREVGVEGVVREKREWSRREMRRRGSGRGGEGEEKGE